MKFKLLIFANLALFISIAFMGCQNSPGGVLSPKSDIHVITTSPDILGPKDSSGASGIIDFPNLTVSLGITNGVSVFLDAVDIHYFGQDGISLASGSFDAYLGLSKLIKAPDLGEELSTSGGGNTVNFEVITPRLFSYMVNGTLQNYLDDISPVVAKVLIRGRDTNNHKVALSSQVNITTVAQKGGI